MDESIFHVGGDGYMSFQVSTEDYSKIGACRLTGVVAEEATTPGGVGWGVVDFGFFCLVFVQTCVTHDEDVHVVLLTRLDDVSFLLLPTST